MPNRDVSTGCGHSAEPSRDRVSASGKGKPHKKACLARPSASNEDEAWPRSSQDKRGTNIHPDMEANMTRDEVRSSSYEDPKTGCWLWHGKTPRGPTRRVYTALKGPIPKGLWVLHTCDVPKCVNPDHLWLGDRRDNIVDCTKKGRVYTYGLAVHAKKTHCPKGHPYDEKNTIHTVYPNGDRCRECRTCKNERHRKWYASKRKQ